MKLFTKSSLLVMCIGLFGLTVNAQSLSGIVTSDEGEVIGANVLIEGTTSGTTSDFDGSYRLEMDAGTYQITFSYLGYVSQTLDVIIADGEDKKLDVFMESDAQQLEDVVVVGTRTAPRSSTSTPLPVDMISTKDLASTGQASFDKALQYRIPSFNTVQTPVNDATSLLDPYEIRNMGPSRTLILINGKRKNMSALLYTQTSPGRGETGADISAIPQDAIKRVEILRDGASAQYGSDAIAGVMNIILKDRVDQASVTLRAGMTSKGDGENIGLSFNNGNKIGDKGFINYTVDFSKSYLMNRPGTVDAAGEAIDFEADIADVQSFLNQYPDAGNINGSPETTAAKFAVNGGLDITENTEVYFNAAYVYKNVNSFANYRTPYWRTEAAFPYLADFFPNGPGGTYIGYVPTFDGLLNDYNGTLGFRNERNGWITDGSITFGGNKQTYTVSNSHNRNEVFVTNITDANGNGSIDEGEISLDQKYRENSPISFDPGGTAFSHVVGNIDITKRISDKFAFAFGSEFRTESFTVIEGQEASYEGGGADSFAGNTPENSGKFNRYNVGAYADFAFDFTDDFLVNVTGRVENYSDFGNAFVWKLSSRYKFADDKLTLRGSASTGFRAPTLHQIYTQKAQFSFVPGQGIQVGGLVSNISPQANLLNIPELTAEKSTNITLGIGAKPFLGFNFTLDYYNISVKDRILLSTEIGATDAGGTELDNILTSNNLSDLSFFVNAIDTRTSGIDFVANYRKTLTTGKVSLNLSGNYTIQNERDGAVKNPDIVAAAGQSVVNRTQEALFFTSRPVTKWILGVSYELDKWAFSVNNTYFGKTIFKQQGLDDNLRTEFIPKIVTDLAISWNPTDKLTFALNINNILNVLPEWKFVAENAAGTTLLNNEAEIKNQSNLITFNQRYSQMTYDGSHFSQFGTMMTLSANVRF